MSYEDTGQFEAVVDRLNDPLTDPLPGRPPVVPEAAHNPGAARPVPGPAGGAGPGPAAPGASARPYPAGAYPRVPEPPSRPYAAPAGPVAAPYAEPVGPYGRPSVPGARHEAAEWFAPPGAQQPGFFPGPGQGPANPAQGPASQAAGSGQGPASQAYGSGHGSAPAPGGGADDRTAKLPAVETADPAGDTAVLGAVPALGGDAGPDESPDGPVTATPAAEPVVGPPPATGGRAARRKAAKSAGHRRGRAAAPPAGPGDGSQPAVPMTRMEARRAAKAAKDSPAVVISRVVGELFITTGVLMLLFVTYQLWWTNVRAHEQANSASNKLEQQWKNDQSDPDRNPGTFSPGQGFAIMYIPKLDVKAPIAQGVDKSKVLDHGMVGHYDGALNTAMPWDKTGNFAVAAHRNTHGEPFRYINHLVPGDKVVVETATTYYTYEITSSLASTPPTNISVLQPIPVGSGFTKPGRYITLTTCTPEFTSTNRLIVWGKMVEERPRSEGKPDALVNK
jgi:sortase A